MKIVHQVTHLPQHFTSHYFLRTATDSLDSNLIIDLTHAYFYRLNTRLNQLDSYINSINNARSNVFAFSDVRLDDFSGYNLSWFTKELVVNLRLLEVFLESTYNCLGIFLVGATEINDITNHFHVRLMHIVCWAANKHYASSISKHKANSAVVRSQKNMVL